MGGDAEGDLVRLAVAAPSGSRLSMGYSDRLGAGTNWQTMSNFTLMGSMSQMTDTPPPGSHARFYRAAMMP